MQKKFSKKQLFFFSAIPFLLFLLILEFGVRVFWEFEPNRVLCYDPVMGRGYCPNTKGFLTENKIKMHVEVNSDGLLGKAYPGYFDVGDTAGLTELLARAEADPRFYRCLQTACQRKSALVQPKHELDSWRAFLRELEMPGNI